MTYLISGLIVVGTMLASSWLAARGKRISLQEWAVSGRRLGVVLFWFLSAGEIFTTFAFLGASGWAYAYGAPGFYILGNVALGYALGYWFLPRIWAIAKTHSMLTQADYYRQRFDSPWLGSLLAIVGIIALIPYVQLQFTGLGLILKLTFGPTVNTDLLLALAGLIVLGFILITGLQSVAFGSIVKDVLMIIILLGIALTVPALTGLGSISAVFAKMDQLHPNYAWLPGLVPKQQYTPLWFMSTLLMTNLGYWMWPQTFQYTFSGRSADVIRKNAIFQPLYALAYFFTFAIGFTALLVLPNLKDSNSALLALSAKVYPDWFVGVIAGGGMLIAIIPGSSLLLTAGTLFAKNVYRDLLRPRATDNEVLLASRLGVVATTVIAVYLAIHSNQTLVSILLVAYSAISQLAPSVLLSLLWRRVTQWGALAGVVIGLIGISVPQAIAMEKSIAFTMNTGFVAVLINFVAVVVVSLLTRAPSEQAISVGLDPVEA